MLATVQQRSQEFAFEERWETHMPLYGMMAAALLVADSMLHKLAHKAAAADCSSHSSAPTELQTK
jgi:hypothetical protein